ncbi:MAG: RNA-binding protein [Nitrospirota bacterium]
MGKKLYVGSISFNASEDDLVKLFSSIGEVESAKIITDANTGQSKGFAFIEMASEDDAKKAITDLNGTSFMERTIVVNEARPKPPREKRDFGGGRGGFDRGRGGYGNSKGRGGAGSGRRGRR